jgi:ActR/RegA family two-component response regulator
MRFNTESLASSLSRTFSSPKRLLLLDDDLAWTQFLRAKLDPYNVLMDVCLMCSEARVALARERYDCLVLDQILTNGKGVDLYREVSVKFPSIQVVFLTGYPVEPIVEKVSAIGPARVFNKNKMLEDGFIEQLMAQLGVAKLS